MEADAALINARDGGAFYPGWNWDTLGSVLDKSGA